MNATLRSVFVTASLITASLGAILYSSCAEEKCKAVVCANGSVCADGGCICPSGYEGPQCEVTNRDRFIGAWQVSEDGTVSGSAQYPVVIEKGTGITQVVIKNFSNYITENVIARVKGDSIFIDPQTFKNGYSTQGIGYVSDDKFYGKNGRITLKYELTNNFGVVNDFGYLPGSNTLPSIWTK